MSVKLRVGVLQKKLVRTFTTIETRTLTIWFYLSAGGLYLIIYGVSNDNVGAVLVGVVLSLVSIAVLDSGLEDEHTVATETGNAGPDATEVAQ